MSMHPFCRDCHLTSRFMCELRARLLAVGKFPKVRRGNCYIFRKARTVLTEAPRLLYVRVRVRLTGLVTMTGFRCARAAFTKNDSAGKRW